MKRVLIGAIIVLCIVLSILGVLQIKSVDAYLTDLICEPKAPEKNYIIHSDDYGREYDIDDPALPFIYVENRMLYMSYKSEAINITPAGINVSYYDKKTDLNETLRFKDNCIVSDDGRYVVFLLEFNGMPYLYYCDFRYMTFGFISDKVNSFEIVSIPGVKGPCVFYATGYEASNRLMLFYNGDNHLIKTDVVADYDENHNKAVILDYRHMLYEYDFDTLSIKVIDHKVADVHFSSDEFNYNDAYDNFSVYYEKEDGLYFYDSEKVTKTDNDFKSISNELFYGAPEGYYSLKDGRLALYNGENATAIAPDVGYIHSIIQHDSMNGNFVVHAEDSIFAIVGGNAVEILELDHRYRYDNDAISKYLSIFTADYNNFYIGMLTGGTVIVNLRNTDSWLNKINNYVYGVYHVNINNPSQLNMLNVPVSRQKPEFRAFDTTVGTRVLYTARYSDSSVRSLSLLSADGVILSGDVLASGDEGIKKNDIQVYFANDGVYIMFESSSIKELYKFSEDASYLITETKDIDRDFIVATSFGEMIIFVLS